MLTPRVIQAAEEFATSLQHLDEMKTFQAAQERFRNDPGILELRRAFAEKSALLHANRSNGGFSQDETEGVSLLQRQLNEHPATVEFVHTRQALLTVLQESNVTLSRILGFDFASLAAPSSCCG